MIHALIVASGFAGQNNVFTVISAVIVAVFGSGGLYAFISIRRQNKRTDAETLKFRAEADKYGIETASELLSIHDRVLEDLRQQLKDQRTHIDEQDRIIEDQRQRLRKCEALESKIESLQERFREMLEHLDVVQSENLELKHQMSAVSNA